MKPQICHNKQTMGSEWDSDKASSFSSLCVTVSTLWFPRSGLESGPDPVWKSEAHIPSLNRWRSVLGISRREEERERETNEQRDGTMSQAWVFFIYFHLSLWPALARPAETEAANRAEMNGIQIN